MSTFPEFLKVLVKTKHPNIYISSIYSKNKNKWIELVVEIKTVEIVVKIKFNKHPLISLKSENKEQFQIIENFIENF